MTAGENERIKNKGREYFPAFIFICFLKGRFMRKIPILLQKGNSTIFKTSVENLAVATVPEPFILVH